MTPTETPTYYGGLGGNMYLICSQKEPLLPICDLLDKSRNSVYFNKKYQCYAIRVKSRLHKKILKNVYGGKQ